MKVLWLGTGSALSKERYHTNALIETKSGKRVLLDCGYTAYRALLDIGLGMNDVDGCMVTHLHGDHVLGLERLAIETHIVQKQRIPLWVPEAIEKPLWNNVLQGLLGGTWNDFQSGTTREKQLDDVFEVHTVRPDEAFDAFGLTCIPFTVPHLKGRSTVGYLMQESDQSSKIVMIVPDASLASAIDQSQEDGSKTYMDVYGAVADVIFHDCFSKEPKLPSHTSLEELQRLPAEIQAKTFLIHDDDGALEDVACIDDISAFSGMQRPKERTWLDFS